MREPWTLPPGTEAFVTFGKESGKESKSGPRSRLDGAARVRITGYRDGKYQTEVIAGSGISEDAVQDFPREALFVTPDEREYFGQLVSWLWGGIPMTMKRPALKGGTDA